MNEAGIYESIDIYPNGNHNAGNYYYLHEYDAISQTSSHLSRASFSMKNILNLVETEKLQTKCINLGENWNNFKFDYNTFNASAAPYSHSATSNHDHQWTAQFSHQNISNVIYTTNKTQNFHNTNMSETHHDDKMPRCSQGTDYVHNILRIYLPTYVLFLLFIKLAGSEGFWILEQRSKKLWLFDLRRTWSIFISLQSELEIWDFRN